MVLCYLIIVILGKQVLMSLPVDVEKNKKLKEITTNALSYKMNNSIKYVTYKAVLIRLY